VRQFIRHPFDVTIRYTVGEVIADAENRTKNISEGGLCFKSPTPIAMRSLIHIEIPIQNPPFKIDGVVVWCRPVDKHYEVGVKFEDDSRSFALRMVEQACHIKHYQQEVLQTQGRELSTEQAASEWISIYAQVFPR
jgi:hypothetical protein